MPTNWVTKLLAAIQSTIKRNYEIEAINLKFKLWLICVCNSHYKNGFYCIASSLSEWKWFSFLHSLFLWCRLLGCVAELCPSAGHVTLSFFSFWYIFKRRGGFNLPLKQKEQCCVETLRLRHRVDLWRGGPYNYIIYLIWNFQRVISKSWVSPFILIALKVKNSPTWLVEIFSSIAFRGIFEEKFPWWFEKILRLDF